MKKVTITIKASIELKEKLKKYAEEDRRGLAPFVVLILEKWIAEKENK